MRAQFWMEQFAAALRMYDASKPEAVAAAATCADAALSALDRRFPEFRELEEKAMQLQREQMNGMSAGKAMQQREV